MGYEDGQERPGVTPPEPTVEQVNAWRERATEQEERKFVAFGSELFMRSEMHASVNTYEFARLIIEWATPLVADQQLEACLGDMNMWGAVNTYGTILALDLHRSMRPKPVSLAEQGLKALDKGCFPSADEVATLRQVCERLAELEQRDRVRRHATQ